MNNITSYESPVDIIIIGQMEINLQNDIIQAIQKIGIDINKEELIKALNYDRNQYETGYKDGYMKAKEDLKTALVDVSLTDMQRNVISAILENLF